MNMLLVGIGGVLGSISRYEMGRIIASKNKSGFPAGTFLINIIGAVCLGLVSSISLGNNAFVFLGDGFLGAFTTFSTFMYEGFNLIRGNERLNAAAYVGLSVFLGVLGYALGVILAGIK